MQIKVLNNETINKIAAGEVIVRPASAIKELVENAIDAGARNIKVVVENGGKSLMAVSDDGWGIPYNQVPLAFKRHATSKISTIDDLTEVSSLGFRGEALSSIAAISKVSITTKAADEDVGSRAMLSGGKLENQRVSAYDRGTEIRVTDLFYNTPARKKHLSKDKNEERAIRDLMEKLALSHPEIGFTYINDEKTAFKTTGSGNLKDVIEGLYGRAFFSGLRELSIDNSPMALSGYIGDLTAMKGTRNEQIFFMNGRYIKNKSLSRAFEEAYEGYTMMHKHPVGIVFITLPGRMLDVNIHPAKTEIQILNESLVTLLFKQGIRECLKAQNLIVDAVLNENETENEPENQSFEEPVDIFDLNKEPSSINSDIMDSGIEFTESSRPAIDLRIKDDSDQDCESAAILSEDRVSEQRTAYGSEHRIVEQNERAILPDISGPLSKSKTYAKPHLEHLKIIGQLFSTYIMLEGKGEIYLIDQHAAHEAFMFQELRERFASDADFPSQALLVPQPVEISPKEAAQFESMSQQLSKYGFDCDLFGETTVMVRSVPIMLGEPQEVELLRAFIDSAFYDDMERPKDHLDRIVMMSCKAAIKANQNLSESEIRTLLTGLSTLDNPYTCPHGRPIILKLKEYELRKLFKRVVS